MDFIPTVFDLRTNGCHHHHRRPRCRRRHRRHPVVSSHTHFHSGD